MLTAYDLKRMRNDVHDIIDEWGEVISIWTPQSSDKQASWDARLHTTGSNTTYDITFGVNADIRYISINKIDNNVAGYKDDGNLHVKIRDDVVYKNDSIFVLGNALTQDQYNTYKATGLTDVQILDKVVKWDIDKDFSAIGEQAIYLKKLVG